VIEAANCIALDPANRHLRRAMGTFRIDQYGRPALATVQGKVLRHDSQRRRPAAFQIDAVVDRLPELAKKSTADGAWSCLDVDMIAQGEHLVGSYH
jgi:hypothetical protein